MPGLREHTQYSFDERNYARDREALLAAHKGFHLKHPTSKKFGLVLEIKNDIVTYCVLDDSMMMPTDDVFESQVDDFLNAGWCCD